MESRTATVLMLVSIVLLSCIRFPLAQNRLYDPDEFEHLHATWSVKSGQVLYRDFFEHHPPLFYFSMLPLMEVDGDAATLTSSRFAMIPLAMISVLMIHLIAAGMSHRSAGYLAAFVMCSLAIFLRKTLEIRPDVPALMLSLSGLYFFLGATSSRRFVLSGALVGLSLLFTPKGIFALAGLVLAALFPVRAHWKHIAAFVLGLVLPVIPTALLLARQEALSAAIFFNLQFNRLISYQYQWSNLSQSFLPSLEENPLFWSLGMLALIATLIRLVRDRFRSGSWKQQVLLSAYAVGGLLGILLIQVPLPQYLLIIAAPLSILTALRISDVSREVFDKMGGRAARSFVMAILFLFIVQTPLPIIAEMKRSNRGQIEVLEYVWQVTKPDESVFDCWTGLYVFRPHSFFYFFLGPDIHPTLDRISDDILRGDLLEALRESRPKVVIVDRELRKLPSEIRSYVSENYRAERYRQILIRQDRQNDESDPGRETE